MKLENVIVENGEVVISVKTSATTSRFIMMPIEAAQELYERLPTLLNQSHQAECNMAYEG